jgi:hypothetical protein
MAIVEASPSPPRPLSQRAANLLGGALERLGVRACRFPEDELMAEARRRAGAADFGDPAFLVPLGHLLRSLEREARLNYIGQKNVRNLMVQLLVRRLGLQRDLGRHPEIAAVALPRPLVVFGMARSGTTLLQSLLMQAPGCLSLEGWELAEPWPAEREGWSDESDPRRARHRARIAAGIQQQPQLHAMHPFDSPLECSALFSQTFVSAGLCIGYDVPGYEAWLEAQEAEIWHRVYAYYRTLLQRIAWFRRRTQWVLKSPDHLSHLDSLTAAFPDVCAVHLHRDPQKSVPSTCSLAASRRAIHSDRVDLRRIGELVLRRLAGGIRHNLEARSRINPARIVDLRYTELVRDPIGSVRRIHDHFGLGFEPAMEQGMARWLAAHPQPKGGAHRASLATFGLTAEQVDGAFAGYRERFGLSAE